MENLIDYSHYVIAAYSFAIMTLGALFIIISTKYFCTKSKVKNEKSS